MIPYDQSKSVQFLKVCSVGTIETQLNDSAHLYSVHNVLDSVFGSGFQKV